MNGARTAPEKYCNINSFLKVYAPTLFENMEDLCILGSLSTKKGDGITFLLPDAKTISNINTVVGKDVKKAAQLIGALIIPKFLPSLRDFSNNKNNIPNSLSKQIEIKNVSTTGVEFSNGIHMDGKNIYNASFDKNRVAVYKINGLMSTEGSPLIIEKVKRKKGGNDIDIKDTRCDNGRTLEYLLKSAKINAVLQAEMTQNDYILTLGISLLNYMVNGSSSDFISRESKERLNMIGKICRRVHPHSPLYYLHLISLLTDDERGKWCDVILMYSKYDTLANFIRDGYNSLLESKWDAHIIKTVRSFKRDNICETAKHVFTERCNTILRDLNPNYEAWGGYEHFINWLLGVVEFTYLYADHYMNAIDNKDKDEINTIVDTYVRWYVTNNTSYANKLILLDDSLSNNILIFTKERFCTILSLTLSRAFSPMGSNFPTRGEKYATSDNVTVSDNHAPNKIIVSAYITNRYANHVSRFLKN